MSLDRMFGAMNTSASGAAAERLRMEVVANNIANASSTRTPEGGPFRRHDVVFSAVLRDHIDSGVPEHERLGGVRVLGIVEDPSELPRVYNPGHPDAEVTIQDPGDTGLNQGDVLVRAQVNDVNAQARAAGQQPATFEDTPGFVTMPNVKLPIEMVNLVTATRAYEANLRMMQSFREMAEQSISLIRG